MKKTNRISLIAMLATLTSAGLYAQPPSGTPAGSQATGTTNSGGVAPAAGKPTTTPTGPTAGGTGSGTTPPAPTTPTVGGTGTTTTGGNTTTTTPPTSPGKGPNENASETAKTVHNAIAEFQKTRNEYLASRRVLLDAVKNAATAEARKSALEALHEDNQNRAEQERNLGKQIREDLKALREQRKSGGS